MTYRIEPATELPADISEYVYDAQLLEFALSAVRVEASCRLMEPPMELPRDGNVARQLEQLNNSWLYCLCLLHDNVATERERKAVEGNAAFSYLRKWLNVGMDDVAVMKQPDFLDYKDFVASIRFGGFAINGASAEIGGDNLYFIPKEAKQKFEKYLEYKFPNWKGSPMSLIERIKEQREEGLREKDYFKRSVLGQLIDKADKEAKKSNRETTDADIITAAKKIIEGLGETRKFLVDAKVPREDARHQTLCLEEAILSPYVPAQMTKEELLKVVTDAGIEKNKGKVMAYFKSNFHNQYDGATAASAADEYIKPISNPPTS